MKLNYKKAVKMNMTQQEYVDSVVDELYDRMFSKRYSGYDKIFLEFNTYMVKGNGIVYIKNLIKELLIKGADVRTGYAATSIKGCHNLYIFEGGFAN